MASVVITGDTSGAITLAAPATAGTNTITLPANTGTMLTTASTFAGTGPAFSASKSTNQTITSSFTFTKVTFDTEDFDTNSNFASSTFTPTVAGYYIISCTLTFEALIAQNNIMHAAIYKNGVSYRQVYGLYGPTNGMSISHRIGANGSAVIYCNGTTDYIEIYAYQTYGASGAQVNSNAGFSGCLVRAA